MAFEYDKDGTTGIIFGCNVVRISPDQTTIEFGSYIYIYVCKGTNMFVYQSV